MQYTRPTERGLDGNDPIYSVNETIHRFLAEPIEQRFRCGKTVDMEKASLCASARAFKPSGVCCRAT